MCGHHSRQHTVLTLTGSSGSGWLEDTMKLLGFRWEDQRRKVLTSIQTRIDKSGAMHMSLLTWSHRQNHTYYLHHHHHHHHYCHVIIDAFRVPSGCCVTQSLPWVAEMGNDGWDIGQAAEFQRLLGDHSRQQQPRHSASAWSRNSQQRYLLYKQSKNEQLWVIAVGEAVSRRRCL